MLLASAGDPARATSAPKPSPISQVANITLSDDGRTAVANTNVPYELDAIAGEGGTDINVINTLTGAVRRVATKVRGGGQLSPGGKYITWWENRAWRIHDIAANRTRELTSGITGVSCEDESHDTPSEPGSYGLGVWAGIDAAVLVFDRFDVWDVDPTSARAEPSISF